ncbi:hypothetical protein [Epibacterium sp. MM17-32]|uniref:hypothetical protein n=1 Tax=Epibacterium sp. MM17-32 TaxID=2917734 RepID=UPI001EF74276|nr:hypothetical protein [Epibacterium sp. MM17-32]
MTCDNITQLEETIEAFRDVAPEATEGFLLAILLRLPNREDWRQDLREELEAVPRH